MDHFSSRLCVCGDGLHSRCSGGQVIEHEFPDGEITWHCKWCGGWKLREASEEEKREFRKRLGELRDAMGELDRGDCGT